jgi:hypothetical protein
MMLLDLHLTWLAAPRSSHVYEVGMAAQIAVVQTWPDCDDL